MTYPLTRLKEALVEKFSSDVQLIAMTNEGVLDSVGNQQHIGMMLYEPGLKDRTPFLGVEVMETGPLIPGDSRTHIFRSVIWVYSISRQQCISDKINDRVQYLLTTPEDNPCNGFYDFTNDHIKVHNTEFRERFNGPELKTGFVDTTDTYTSIIEFSIIWTDVPCNDCIEEPDCLDGSDDSPDEPEICEDDFE